MSALPPRRRVSLISVKLGPAHWTRVSHVTFPYLCKQRGTSISLEAFKRRVSLRECYWTRVSHVTISLSNANKGGLLSPSRPSSGEYHFVSAPKLAFLYGRSHIQLETHLRGIKRERHQIYTSICGCMHVCVCVYVYIYIYMHIHTYVYMCIHVYIYLFIYLYVCIMYVCSLGLTLVVECVSHVALCVRSSALFLCWCCGV